MDLKPGMRLQSTVCSTQVVIVRSGGPADLRCGGHELVPLGGAMTEGATVDRSHASGTLLGKRYVAAEAGLEVLCTKAGDGSLSLGDQPLLQKAAKLLPSSD
jgi:hypothetical protein